MSQRTQAEYLARLGVRVGLGTCLLVHLTAKRKVREARAWTWAIKALYLYVTGRI